MYVSCVSAGWMVMLLCTCRLSPVETGDAATTATETTSGVAACDSKIWCDGPLLEAVQTSRMYQDDKTFVDMNLKHDPDTVLAAFSSIYRSTDNWHQQLHTFVHKYFEGPGNELEPWNPTDYVSSPAFLKAVNDSRLKEFGADLCKIWSRLGMKIKDDVQTNQDRYSLIYLEHPFIVPGGRFREIYYWDSYWVMKGLLVCEMTTTVKGMLQNLISFVKRFGLVPNGGRIYYTRRSQPPLLVPMVDLYLQQTGDLQFLRDNLPYLEAEYTFWMTNRSVVVGGANGNSHTLNRYATPTSKPRPESYLKDLNTAKEAGVPKDSMKAQMLYANLASAAESGWDFSSRWFSREYNETSDKTKWLGYIRTSDVIPVDLNSILCWNERLLSKFHRLVGNNGKANLYRTAFANRRAAMQDIFWHSTAGSWFDYSLSTGSTREEFYPSNLFPLYTGCVENSKKAAIEQRVLNYLKGHRLLEFPSGVPTSLVQTGQQWDMPNAWPPLQDVVISALADSDNVYSRQSALALAQSWVYSNWRGWKRTQHMFEKYLVTTDGSRGGGGEYDVQEGFGWTNGIVLSLLERFGGHLSANDASATTGAPNSAMLTMTIALLLLCAV